jgi:phosphatidylglycerophosphate synthase
MDGLEYRRRWSQLHGDADTGGLVGWWLGFAYRLGRPPARFGVPPWVFTVAGPAVAALALLPAAGGGRWALAAAAGVLVAAVLDGMDGAVAIQSQRASRQGFVLDSVCDRVADGCFVAALWLAGAPGLVCVLGGAAAWLLEYTRARAGAGGLTGLGVVTVAERPTRVLITLMFLVAAGVFPGAATGWVTAAAVAWCAVGAVGLAQLARDLHRRL